jgi:SNF2 family DNA or RNA helicase
VAENYSFHLITEPNLLAKHKAFPFQEEAVRFAANREYAAIFHEQGLGKTKIALDVALKWLRERVVDTILIVTKKGLISNWEREIVLHTHLRPSILSDNSSTNFYTFTTPTRVVLAHYEALRKERRRIKIWAASRRVAIFLDEAVKIKNPAAALTQTYFELAPSFTKRVIMTGTPSANRPYDVWAPIYFLDRGLALGTDFASFKAETDLSNELRADPVAFQAFQDRLVDTQRRLSEISIRETKAGGCISLPAKEFVRLDCEWEPRQHEIYRQVQEELRAVIVRDGVLQEEDQEVVLKRLLRLIQITSNPAIIDESYTYEPGKFAPLYDLLTDITRQGQKAIVFTNFNAISDWLVKALRPFGALKLNGKMKMSERESAVKWFIGNTQDQVLVATTAAAKEGLTLTVANHVIFYDRTYSLDDYLQAQDRIHRVSQTRTCYVYNLIISDSIDEWIDLLIEQKRLAAQLTQGDIGADEYGSRADLAFVDLLGELLNH